MSHKEALTKRVYIDKSDPHDEDFAPDSSCVFQDVDGIYYPVNGVIVPGGKEYEEELGPEWEICQVIHRKIRGREAFIFILPNAKAFENMKFEVDKMAGLRVAAKDRGEKKEVLNVQGWDQGTPNEVRGRLINEEEQTVWEGILITAEEIAQIFQPLDEAGSNKTYARRRGRLGQPKNVGIIRVETRNAINFDLVLHNGGGQKIKTVTTIDSPNRLTLEVQVKDKILQKVLFDIGTHRKKIAKLLGEE